MHDLSSRGFWIVFVAFWSSEDSNSSARSGCLRGTLFRTGLSQPASWKRSTFLPQKFQNSLQFESKNLAKLATFLNFWILQIPDLRNPWFFPLRNRSLPDEFRILETFVNSKGQTNFEHILQPVPRVWFRDHFFVSPVIFIPLFQRKKWCFGYQIRCRIFV